MKKIVTGIVLFSCIISICFTDNNKPKKTALVLSGGGVKGFGHLGTLYLIDSLNIPIDLIVGSSIGAISAALYATGHSPEEIDQIGARTNWSELFGQSPRRNGLYYFQKLDGGKFQLTFGLNGFRPTTPISLSSGQYSYENLLKLFQNYSNVGSYDDFIIPFRCNATDIITGDEIIYTKGALAKVLRTSSSIPTVFTPIKEGTSLLVDGGLINNLPTNIAKDLDSDFIIASNVITTQKSNDEIIDVFGMISQIIDLYGLENQRANSLGVNILLQPRFDDISSIETSPEIIEIIKKEGKKEAYRHIDKFLELAQRGNTNPYVKLSSIKKDHFTIQSIYLSNNLKNDDLIQALFLENSRITKDKFIDKILRIRGSNKYHNLSYKFEKVGDNTFNVYLNGITNNPIMINTIKVNGNKKISQKDFLRMLAIDTSEELKIKLLNKKIQETYKSGYFEYINYDLISIDNIYSDLIINVKEVNNKQLKLGVIWDNHYKLIGKVKWDILNKPLKRLRIQDELIFSGFKQNKFTLYYLVLDNNKIDILPFIRKTNRIQTLGIFNKNIIEYVKHNLNSISYGLTLSMMEYGSLSFEANHSDNEFNGITNNINFSQATLDIDQLDDLLNPRYGYNIMFNYKVSNGETENFDYLNIQSQYFKTFYHNHTFRFFSLYKKASDNIPVDLLSTYGGYNWAVGYNEFTLSSYDLSLLGIEYQFHYKNSTTFRFIINHIEKNNTLINAPTNYGFGIKIRSILGPINFTWGRGYEEPFNKESKRTNIFYFNFGVEI